LITLARSYCCATTYADTAAATLSVGSTPSGYSTLSLFTKTRKDVAGITTFDCQYHGASGSQYIKKSKVFRTYDLQLDDPAQSVISGKYISALWVIEKAVAKDTDTISTPSGADMGTSVVYSYNTNGLPNVGSDYTLNSYVDLLALSSVNYGAVDVLSKTFGVVTPKG
jgi:hypothetical protein